LVIFCASIVVAALAQPLPNGENPSPAPLALPETAPLSDMAQLGAQIFHDTRLSSSGRMSCATCHAPQHAYGPPNGLPAMFGGPILNRQGVRAVPSLMYLYAQPNFSIGPDMSVGDRETAPPTPANQSRVTKTAQDNAQTAINVVPQGGLFWDGRVNTLQQQAIFPMLSPFEMDGRSVARLAARLRAAPYAPRLAALFGQDAFADAAALVDDAAFALSCYEQEARSFFPYSSKFDSWLQGKARFTQAEARGYALFNDPKKGDCAACHLDQPTPDGRPPLFTDHQFEALGVPRNPYLAANENPDYHDLGLCGPYRTDMTSQTQFCGLFLTPTLRNVATRHVFMHNGEYHTLKQVLDFYDFRDTEPQKIYPPGPDGKPQKYNDLPAAYQANIDTIDPPFDRQIGQKPALSPGDEQDIIAFLDTLTDGFSPR